MKLIINIFLLLLLPVLLNAQVFQTKTGYAEFESEMPVESFKGISNHLTGQISLADSTIDFFLDLTTIATGIRLRDRQMRELYLETDQFPFAEFTGKLYTPFHPDSDEIQDAYVRGEFTVHGVTRMVDITGTIQRSGENRIIITASWMLHLPDYDIQVPGLMFYRLSEELKMQIRADMERIP